MVIGGLPSSSFFLPPALRGGRRHIFRGSEPTYEEFLFSAEEVCLTREASFVNWKPTWYVIREPSSLNRFADDHCLVILQGKKLFSFLFTLLPPRGTRSPLTRLFQLLFEISQKNDGTV